MDEGLVARIVMQVMALLNTQRANSPERVLVLFSGASSGQQEGLDTISFLCRAGHFITAVFSPTAVYLVGELRVRQAGAHKLILPGTWADAPGLVRESNLILIPTLSMNLAAQMALGLFENLLSTLALGALLAGKPVIAVRDGADPDGNAGRVFGANGSAPALRQRLAANLKALNAYGMELVSAESLLAVVQRHLVGGDRVAPMGDHRKVASSIITQADLTSLEAGGMLHLPKGSRLTPLAQETIARMGVQVILD